MTRVTRTWREAQQAAAEAAGPGVLVSLAALLTDDAGRLTRTPGWPA